MTLHESTVAVPVSIGGYSPVTIAPASHFVARLDDAMLLVVVVVLFPAVILLFGVPIALIVRGLIEIGRRI